MTLGEIGSIRSARITSGLKHWFGIGAARHARLDAVEALRQRCVWHHLAGHAHSLAVEPRHRDPLRFARQRPAEACLPMAARTRRQIEPELAGEPDLAGKLPCEGAGRAGAPSPHPLRLEVRADLNNYLAAYDDGACTIPNPNAREISLGNEPDAKREALGKTEVPARSRTPWDFHEGGMEINLNLSGVKVGLFPPNGWGLNDVMGNVRELTSDTISGEEFVGRNPGDRFAQYTRDKAHAVLKGSQWWVDPAWAAEGIDAERYAVIYGDCYSANVAIRLTY